MSQEGNKTLPVNMQYVSVKLTHWNYQEIIDPDRDCLYLTLKTFKNSNLLKCQCTFWFVINILSEECLFFIVHTYSIRHFLKINIPISNDYY